MAEQIVPGLWRLEIPLVGNPLKNLNSYLITGERNLLIDTGFNQIPCREAMELQLRKIGVELDRTDIFLTHLHSDHTGLSGFLHRDGCRVFIGALDGRRIVEYAGDQKWHRIYEGYIRDGFTREQMETLWNTNPAKMAGPGPAVPYTWLEDGTTLTYGGRTLRCVQTPGHTPGHMCLYDGENRVLFSGDHVLFHITPNICRWDGVPDSLGDYLSSLDKVRDLPVELLLPAHRQETGELKQRVEELQEHHAHRIAEAFHTVRETPGLTAYEIAGRMHWSIRSRNWEEFPLTQKYFAVGEALAHLDYLEIRGFVRHFLAEGKNRYAAVNTQNYKGES